MDSYNVKRAKILLIIDLPPPTHGMSVINMKMLEFLDAGDADVRVFNTAPSYASKFFGTKFYFFVKLVHFLVTLPIFLVASLGCRAGVAYRPINGGKGQIYDWAYIAFLRLLKMEIYIHHHSFAYLNGFSKIFNALKSVVGQKATHIALGNKMKEKLVEMYSIPDCQVRILSNISFFEINKPSGINVVGGQPLKIGYLSNITVDKGFDSFIESFQLMKQKGLNVTAVAAGPICDAQSKYLIESVDEFAFEYLGPVYGEDKESFFKSIDVFIFPSRYVNEAEPLVIYEAASYGCVCIASKKGGISEMLEKIDGFSLSSLKPLSQEICDLMMSLAEAKVWSEKDRESRVSLYNQLVLCEKKNLQNIRDRLGGQLHTKFE